MSTITELVDESAAEALAHATALQHRLTMMNARERPELRGLDREMHRLVGDIVSLRNAAELLKRSLPAS